MNAQYFIDKFSAIPDSQWTTGIRRNSEGQRCALGHCKFEESGPLINLFTSAGRDVIATNDNWDPEKQTTPKGRILAALEYIQKNHEK